MKALVLESNENLVYKDVPKPILHAGEVLIKVAYCGICGSDLPRVFDGTAHSYPIVLGHEFSGIVEAVGAEVKNLKLGDRVVAVPIIPCMSCEDCNDGNYSLCGNYSFIGSRKWGAMADYVALPSANVLKIPDNLSFKQAATIEPATVGLHALLHSGFTAGVRVAVIGCGIIGLDTMQWAKIKGANSVTAIGRGEYGLGIAQKIATASISTKSYTIEDILEKHSRGFDYVFECSGADRTMHMALSLVGKKGTVCFVGTPKKEITFSIQEWEQINRKECFVTGSWMSYSSPFPGKEWAETISSMESGAFVDIPERVYQVFPMSEGGDAFQLIRSGKSKGRILLKNNYEE